ncbi:hypothetical protein LSH36_455g02007 [Paralvinella palmiformis]|uniref:Uncharacterized protein n=1 Tax=Paralvinella palmiformis TaxID=53620 RepID=A0AAD9JAL2_9ANNE|nr:hypothetical protein LSH36_455g02007 [Paralvinella palmiformis]
MNKMSKVDTHTVLKLLAAEFERSKQEQIDRFLKDQEELNKRFNEFSIHGDNEKEDEDDSDTESNFTQRMSVYKSRPQTSMGWTELERERDYGFDQDSEGSANYNVSEPDGDQWKSAVATAARVVTAVDVTSEQINLGTTKHPHNSGSESKNRFAVRQKISQNSSIRQQRGQGSSQGQVQGQLLVGLDNRILTRRTSRPRTATGIQSSKGNVFKNQVQIDKNDDVVNDESCNKNRPMRASAPATVSRVRRISWEPENKRNSFLPENNRQSGGLLANITSPPSYATKSKTSQNPAMPNTARNQSINVGKELNAARNPPRNGNKELNTNSFMIISSLNPQVRGSKESLTMEQRYTVEHGGRLPQEYNNKNESTAREVLVRDITTHFSELHQTKMDSPQRTNSRRTILKLPPLEATAGPRIQ